MKERKAADLPFASMWTISRLVKGLLADEPGVRVLDVFWYLTFARQVFKFDRMRLGATLMRPKVKKVVADWKARGLDERVMNRILQEIFSLGWLTSDQEPEDTTGSARKEGR